MVAEIKSWFQQNQTLILFLGAQAVALATGGAALLAYMVKLETRVAIMETRGAEYTIARMDEMRQRITILEGGIKDNKDRIDRVVEILTRELRRTPPDGR